MPCEEDEANKKDVIKPIGPTSPENWPTCWKLKNLILNRASTGNNQIVIVNLCCTSTLFCVKVVTDRRSKVSISVVHNGCNNQNLDFGLTTIAAVVYFCQRKLIPSHHGNVLSNQDGITART